MWGHLHPTAGFPLRPAADLRTAERCTRKAAPVDGPRSGSRSLAQAEVLRALRRVFPDPLIELAQFARTLTAGPEFDDQLDAWAEKWHLDALRDVAELHVYYWAGTPAAADHLMLLTPPPSTLLPVVVLRPRPPTVIDGESIEPIEPDWSPRVVWQPLEELNPGDPLHPPRAETNDESLADYLARARAHYDARNSAPRGRMPARSPAVRARWCMTCAGRPSGRSSAPACRGQPSIWEVLCSICSYRSPEGIGKKSRPMSTDASPARQLRYIGENRLRTGSVARFGRAEPATRHREGAVFRMKSRRFGEPPRNRTENPQIKSLLLCQLS